MVYFISNEKLIDHYYLLRVRNYTRCFFNPALFQRQG